MSQYFASQNILLIINDLKNLNLVNIEAMIEVSLSWSCWVQIKLYLSQTCLYIVN